MKNFSNFFKQIAAFFSPPFRVGAREKTAKNTLCLCVFVFLLLSLAWNTIQRHQIRNIKKPLIVEEIHSDTVTYIDTIYITLRGTDTIFAPLPVAVDTTENTATYRDTTRTQWGWIVSQELVRGQILSKKIEFEFSVPEYYNTRIITNTITRTVRNNLLFVDAGFSAHFGSHVPNLGINPNLGLTYIWRNHTRIARVSYSLDKRIEFNIGFNLIK